MNEFDFIPHIGVDESGKGDFFGPLCVAGVLVDERGSELFPVSYTHLTLPTIA